MPQQKVTHWNPSDSKDRTRCGYRLVRGNTVKWTLDLADVDCNRCIRLAKADEAPAPESAYSESNAGFTEYGG